nr:hypothetical protein [Tanacetum cinerariifolium]
MDAQASTTVAPPPLYAPTLSPSTIATISTTVNEQLEAEVLTRSSNSSKTSYAVTADLSEMELKKNLIDKMEGNKSIHQSDEQRNLYKALLEAYEYDKIILETYGDTVTLKRRRDDDANKDEEPSAGSDRGPRDEEKERSHSQLALQRRKLPGPLASLHKGLNLDKHLQASLQLQRSQCRLLMIWKSPLIQSLKQISELAKKTDSRSSFNELMDTPVDFSTFLMNRLKVDTLTPKLLAGKTYELMNGSCKSLVELEFFQEEVYKATLDQLDWINPEGQQYLHNLLKPLPLIPNSRGRRVIPFDHFINNDLEYLCGGASSCKYTTSVTKTKAANYRHIKWIEDLVPRTMKSARDVYFKRRIIAVTELKIVKWHNYKHLDWITMRRDDAKLYKFKEGDFKRLRIQDIEDIMFTRSIVIQRRVEDLQLGVKSYQKKLNLTRPDTYRYDLKRKEAYIAYSNPRGFIYQNKESRTGYEWMIDDGFFEMITLSMCHKITLASDTLIDFQIKFSISIGEIVTHWFTLIVLSALRRFDNKNMLSLMNLVNPYGFAGYSNQTQMNDKAIFVPPLYF